MPHITLNFPNWDAFVTQAEDGIRLWQSSAAHSHVAKIGNDPWYGTATWAEALQYARRGWHAGRSQLLDAMAQVKPTRDFTRAIHRDVAGAYPIIPLAVAGDPCCMSNVRNTSIAAHPVIRVDYNNSSPSKVPARAIVNHGAAMLTIIDHLEQSGYQCELRLIFHSASGTIDSHKTIVRYKAAGEHIDLDRAAFALINPATKRRLVFSLREQVPGYGADYRSALGTPQSSVEDDEPNTVTIFGATEHETNPDTARERVEAAFASYLA